MPEMITTNDAQYAFDIVQTICQEVGPGLPGSFQERERATILQKELESHLGAEHDVLYPGMEKRRECAGRGG